MAKIRSAADIAKKWVTVTPQRTEQYTAGVKTPKEDWKTNTSAAESSYELGVQQGVARKAFGKGVNAAGTEKWQRGAITAGVQRWGPGVSSGSTAYLEGFAPYRDVIEQTNLPPRYPRGDSRNYERGKVIGQALHDKKVA